jgi:hypothetical protein
MLQGLELLDKLAIKLGVAPIAENILETSLR